MGSILEAAILHHVCIVLVLLWLLNSFNCCHPVAYFFSLIYLYLAHEVYVTKLRKKLQFEEKRESNQRRVLVESETVRWLNHAIEKMWSLCMEQIVSQKILLPMVPWFLQKYKPWTVKDVEVQHLYLGRSPPMFTEIRVLRQTNDDDHLVMELGMNFRTADDMSAILGVKLRKRLGFGMPIKLHLLGMHVEGKVLVGVKFIRKWPFISRLRVCFTGPPYFQMTVKPIFTHGLDVTELPGIAGWIDNLLALVFEQTLVEPNMLVVDVEKFVSPEPDNWFSMDVKDPVGHVKVELLEGADMNPSDLNGLADPYVKGRLGPYRFLSKTKKKTLAPKWQEEFKIPIVTWESQNMLSLEVRDKDHIFDDMMGDCEVNINELRDGQRHDMWLPLKNIKMGRLHLAITVSEICEKVVGLACDTEGPDGVVDKRISFAADSIKKGSFSSLPSEKSPKVVADEFEPINIEGYPETGIWIHHPGSEVLQVWEPRKGKLRHLDSQRIEGQARVDGGDAYQSLKSMGSNGSQNDGTSTDESVDTNKSHSTNPVRKGLRRIGSVFRRSPRAEDKPVSLEVLDPSPRYNITESHDKKVGVRLVVDDAIVASSAKTPKGEDSQEHSEIESPNQGHIKDRAKSILKHAGRGLKHGFSRKASRKYKAESGLSPAGKNESLDQSSSDDESRTLSADVPLPESVFVVPGSAVSSPASTTGNNSFKLNDPVVEKANPPKTEF
ncbi:C2 domain-containing protein At1g53590-like isoform X1 [Primulina tabacum]|uniref:C2 domain-containing protein At1g53590-like isoform X1 n=2 Tax=Primulina tabacum TaxID=48773 RepID=UPI003F5939BD